MRLTNKQRILQHLEAGGKIDRWTAQQHFNTLSLLGIIHQIRKERDDIIGVWCRNEKTGKRYKKWFLGRKF